MNRKLLVALIAALLALPVTLVSADIPERDAALDAVAYIETTQEADGGFGGFGPGQTVDAVLAIRAAGVDPSTVTTEGNSPADFLAANAAALAESPGSASKAALAAVALGLDPTDVGGVDLVAAVTGAFNNESGRYAGDAFNQSLAMLGLACTGGDVPDTAIDALVDDQHDDGGWGFEGASDPDTAAIALQALFAAGGDPSSDPASAAVAYFQDAQQDDAGWGVEAGTSNANSTAYAIQALIAAGEDTEAGAYVVDGSSPVGYLASLQAEDGSFPGFDPTFATIQVVPALMGLTYCEAAEAPIQEQPEPTPAPETTSTPAATPTDGAADATATPAAPETGSGNAAGAGSSWTAIVLGLSAFLAGGAALRIARR